MGLYVIPSTITKDEWLSKYGTEISKPPENLKDISDEYLPVFRVMGLTDFNETKTELFVMVCYDNLNLKYWTDQCNIKIRDYKWFLCKINDLKKSSIFSPEERTPTELWERKDNAKLKPKPTQSIDDFSKELSETLEIFVSEWKKKHIEDPKKFRLDLPSISEDISDNIWMNIFKRFQREGEL